MRRLDFIKLIEQNYDKLVRSCKLPVDAREVVHDVIAKMLESECYVHMREGTGNPCGFLYTAIRHRALDVLSRRAREKKLFVSLDSCVTLPSLSPDEVQLPAAWRMAVNRLSSLERCVVEYIYLGNETYHALSARTGYRVTELRQAGQSARKTLRKALSG